MANLKPLLDAAQAADKSLYQIRDQILQLVEKGDDESVKQAKDLRPGLDEAKIKAEEANRLYTSVRDASLVNDNAAALFTAPADPANNDQGVKAKIMNRASFDALNQDARAEFVRGGGKVKN